jgi:hypothetical protein
MLGFFYPLARFIALGFLMWMARLRPLGFLRLVARSPIMGFFGFLARLRLMGFFILLARCAKLGLLRRPDSLGITGFLAPCGSLPKHGLLFSRNIKKPSFSHSGRLTPHAPGRKRCAK